MSKIQYQQKPTTSSTQQPTQPTQQSEHRQTNPARTYNNNRSYNNTSNGYDSNRRPKYQDKQVRHKNKFGFDYDESKIGYNTEIPEMPEKLKQKPEDTKYNKKVEELEKKVSELKKTRKEKKDSYKNGSKQFTDQIEQQKHNIELAKACLVLLNYDKNTIEQDIDEIENKINVHKRKIEFLNKPSQRTSKNVKIEEMTFSDLVREEEKLIQEMSTKNLTKAEEVEYSNKLNKIKKRKVEVPKESVKSEESSEKAEEVQFHRNAIEKLRHIRENLADRITDIDNKIESIEDDIESFEYTIEQIHHKLRNTDNSKLLEQAAQIKQQIYDIWDELKQLDEQHKAKIHDYDYEQEKIKYIQWAKDIKTKKASAWEQEKQQRKKQKLREKEITKKKGDQKDEKPAKQGDKKQAEPTSQNKPAFERTKINRNQKEIDACSFLIQYCKDLGQGVNKTEERNAEKEVKLEDALKKGDWAKMKNVEVIKPKKSKADEQVEQKVYKKKQTKNPVPQTSDRFSHTYFVAQVFDSVKVLPPTKPEELEKLINELEDKMEYYIAHPDEGIEKQLLPVRENERETKTRGPRRIINTEEFPSLK